MKPQKVPPINFSLSAQQINQPADSASEEGQLSDTVAESGEANVSHEHESYDDPSAAEAPSVRRRLSFPPDDDLFGQMEQANISQDDQPSANLAESRTDALKGVSFEENLLRLALQPDGDLQKHASILSEDEVHTFVDDMVRAAGVHHGKRSALIRMSKPYILREREFYNKQGQRNVADKTWTGRKKELAEIYGVGVRTLERDFADIFGKTVSFTFNIPGLVEGLIVKVPKDLLPQVQLLEDRARSSLSSAAEPAEQETLTLPASPTELWGLIDGRLTDCIDEVFHGCEPAEFCARLQEFAQAITDGFFPDLVVEIKTNAL